MEALERMFEDSEDEVTTDEVETEDEELEDEVTTYEVDTEDEELEDLNEFDVELIEFIGDQLDEITDEELDEAIDQLDEVKKIKRSKKPWEAKGMSKSQYKKFLKQKAKDWKKDKAGQKRAAKLAKKRKGKKPKFTFSHYDPSEDVNALIGDSELSEEFKTKASTIFESAVNREVEKQVKDHDLVLEELLVECGGELKEEMAQEVDKYLNYVVEEWIEENKLAVESGIQNELSENFMTGLKQLFTENYVDIPETKVDVVSELANRVQTLEADLEAKLTENIELKESLGDLKRDDLIRSISGDLVETEIEKVKELSTGVDYTGDDEEFIANVQTLKESYFPKGKVNSPVNETDTIQEVDYENLSDSMTAYTNALSRVLK